MCYMSYNWKCTEASLSPPVKWQITTGSVSQSNKLCLLSKSHIDNMKPNPFQHKPQVHEAVTFPLFFTKPNKYNKLFQGTAIVTAVG